MKRILVTGGAGFIGSHLCERLLAAGNEVICVDNLFTGSKQNIVHLLDHPYFEFMRHDVCFPLYVEVDQIFNLACPASPIHYQHDPVQTVKTSVHGAINMLGLAKRLRVRIFQASTSEVYGSPAVHPQPESYWGHVNPVGIRSCYDEGKRCAETLFFDYHRQHRLEIRSGAARTSPKHASACTGSLAPASRKASPRPSTTSQIGSDRSDTRAPRLPYERPHRRPALRFGPAEIEDNDATTARDSRSQ